jgi:hypothetical protein
VRAVLLFLGSYLGVWTFVGVAVYALYRPHGSFAAGAMAIAAGVYELKPLEHVFRRRCCERVRSGFEFGLCWVGSSIGLMLMLVEVGVMSATWMSLIAVLVLAQKFLPAKTGIDVPVALAIVGFGILIVIFPDSRHRCRRVQRRRFVLRQAKTYYRWGREMTQRSTQSANSEATADSAAFMEHRVPRNGHSLYAREYPAAARHSCSCTASPITCGSALIT